MKVRETVLLLCRRGWFDFRFLIWVFVYDKQIHAFQL